jgi:hypothetical protein
MDDLGGPRSIIEGDFKYIVHEQKSGKPFAELFDLKKDPAEEKNLIDQKSDLARKLQAALLKWQKSVLNSLTGADYQE